MLRHRQEAKRSCNEEIERQEGKQNSMDVNEEEDFKKEKVQEGQLPKSGQVGQGIKSLLNESGNQEVTTRCANSFPKVIE